MEKISRETGALSQPKFFGLLVAERFDHTLIVLHFRTECKPHLHPEVHIIITRNLQSMKKSIPKPGDMINDDAPPGNTTSCR